MKLPRLPLFLAEQDRPEFRRNIETSTKSGLATVLAFAALIALAHFLGVSTYRPAYGALVALKLATNTLSMLSLRVNKLVLPAGAVNVFADLVCMTGAIYFTGGPESPLFAVYGIEISIVALLTDLGTTILIGASAVLLFAAMSGLMVAGILPPTRTPASLAGGVTPAYVVVFVAFAMLVFGLPTLYTAFILQKLRQKQAALEARTQELVEAGKHRAQFMANVTHELRTPIHGIAGLSDLVKMGVYGQLNDKQKEAHDDIKRSARSLLTLIDDLLELSRSDAGKLRVDVTDVSIDDAIAQVVGSVRWMRGTRPLSLSCDVEEGLPILRTDEKKLKQIAINLLANAVKFTPDGGSVSVSVRRHGEGVRLVVEDTGIGIPERETARIFEEFRQVDGSNERAYGGMGLGLALVKRLSDVLGAVVEVDSKEGEGSTFSVTFPLVCKPTPTSTMPPPRPYD